MVQKMKKSKGFTLIEMLVVIAIIAVLVSIIIPVVSNSTTKAQAAANAANLRSIKAEITTQVLTGEKKTTDFNATTFSDVKFYGNTGDKLEISFDSNNEVTVKFGGKDIQDWADIAANGKTS